MDTTFVAIAIAFVGGGTLVLSWVLMYGAGKAAGRKEEAERRPRSLIEAISGDTPEARAKRFEERMVAIGHGEDVDEGRP